MIEFPFKAVQTHQGILYRPRANVNLVGPSATMMVDCLVDSGADTTVFSRQVGQFLGWTASPSETPLSIGGISGSLACYQRQIEIEIDTIRFSCTVLWAQSEAVPNLLGRQDVFDRFNIEFCQRARKVIFRLS